MGLRPKHGVSAKTLDFSQNTLYFLQFGNATGGYPFGYKDAAVRCEAGVMRMDKFAVLPLLGIGPNRVLGVGSQSLHIIA
jgi:hypothetical protein